MRVPAPHKNKMFITISLPKHFDNFRTTIVVKANAKGRAMLAMLNSIGGVPTSSKKKMGKNFTVIPAPSRIRNSEMHIIVATFLAKHPGFSSFAVTHSVSSPKTALSWKKKRNGREKICTPRPTVITFSRT